MRHAGGRLSALPPVPVQRLRPPGTGLQCASNLSHCCEGLGVESRLRSTLQPSSGIARVGRHVSDRLPRLVTQLAATKLQQLVSCSKT